MGEISADEFRAAMGSFAAGVTIITTVSERGLPFGLTATAFCSVSKYPPLCLISVARTAEAHPVLVATRKFAVNILAADQQALSTRFGTSGLDKFEGSGWSPGVATGCPLIPGALANIECTVDRIHEAGDHDLLVGLIQRVAVSPGQPLVYYRGRYGDVVSR